ncbi:MAG: hypothetical protein Q8K67_00710 [Geothrix sp.]|nr:hypothetical protein [Geothrix sp.]
MIETNQAEQLQQAISLSSLKESQSAAERAGLSGTSMDKINEDIAAIRVERRPPKRKHA